MGNTKFIGNTKFYETVLDNITDGIYILDDKGNYIFVNSIYVDMTGVSKTELLNYNVYDVYKEGQIKVLISDIVYRKKKKVTMFQDVDSISGKHYRQLVISTPIFDANGNVKNILAICRDVATMNDEYHQASLHGVVSNCDMRRIKAEDASDTIIASSMEMGNLLSIAERIAAVDSAVLIYGESGTGKDVIANYIHERSSRNKNKMVIINCASVPENLLEAELFGYEKGAFTGATSEKKGMIEEASRGTLFLDEINSMPFNIQGKLLRALEMKQIQRLGSNKYQYVDFRLITATNKDLGTSIREGKFRSDLYYRLNVIPITIPPLRNRRDDIVPLADHFLRMYCDKYNKNKLFSKNTVAYMMEYDWPGNVRELKNFVERSVVMSFDDTIEISNIEAITAKYSSEAPNKMMESAFAAHNAAYDPDYDLLLKKSVPLKEYLDRCERKYVEYVLHKYENTYEAAKALHTSQSSVVRRKDKYGIKY